MDEFRLGLMNQMGQNRSRTRRQREPWFYGVACTPVAALVVWQQAGFLLAGGILVAGWGMTVYRHSRISGRELQRLGGQLLVLLGLVATGVGAWLRFG